MNKDVFERIVARAMEDLPPAIKQQIANVAVVVEEWPDDETLDMADVDEPEELLGFYSGIPLTERHEQLWLVLPDKISLFRQPILLTCRNDQEVEAAIRRTLRHELAHYFGIDDERLRDIEHIRQGKARARLPSR